MWKDIKEYEGLYTINENGEIKNKKGELRKINVAKNGYVIVDLYKNNIRNTYLVHRLVAQTFIPNPYNLDIINHKDGDKTNNNVDNLEWCTYSYNLKHAMKHHLRRSNSEIFAHLCKEEVLEIPKMVSWGLSKVEIAYALKVPKATISDIFNGKCWNYLGIDFKSMKVHKKSRWDKPKVLPERYLEYLKELKSKYRVNRNR